MVEILRAHQFQRHDQQSFKIHGQQGQGKKTQQLWTPTPRPSHSLLSTPLSHIMLYICIYIFYSFRPLLSIPDLKNHQYATSYSSLLFRNADKRERERKRDMLKKKKKNDVSVLAGSLAEERCVPHYLFSTFSFLYTVRLLMCIYVCVLKGKSLFFRALYGWEGRRRFVVCFWLKHKNCKWRNIKAIIILLYDLHPPPLLAHPNECPAPGYFINCW